MPFGPFTTDLNLSTAILLGVAWSADLEFSLISAGTQDVVFTTGPDVLALNGATLVSNSVKTEITFYEGTDYTSSTGVVVPSVNRNRNYKTSTLPVSNFETNPVIVIDEGSQIIHTIAYGVSGQGSKGSIYSSIGNETALVLEPNTKYLLRINNLDTNTSSYEVQLIFSKLR